MEIKGIRKFLLNNYKCVKEVIITDLVNFELEHTGDSIDVYLDNKTLYQPNWLIDLQNKIGAEDCLITAERNKLKVSFIIRTKIEGE